MTEQSNPSSVRGLRIASLSDGISYLILLTIAMPLKYIWDMPMAVRVVGMIHGLLYMAFIVLLLQAWLNKRISLKLAGGLFLAAFVPTAPFFFDRYLRQK